MSTESTLETPPTKPTKPNLPQSAGRIRQILKYISGDAALQEYIKDSPVMDVEGTLIPTMVVDLSAAMKENGLDGFDATKKQTKAFAAKYFAASQQPDFGDLEAKRAVAEKINNNVVVYASLAAACHTADRVDKLPGAAERLAALRKVTDMYLAVSVILQPGVPFPGVTMPPVPSAE